MTSTEEEAHCIYGRFSACAAPAISEDSFRHLADPVLFLYGPLFATVRHDKKEIQTLAQSIELSCHMPKMTGLNNWTHSQHTKLRAHALTDVDTWGGVLEHAAQFAGMAANSVWQTQEGTHFIARDTVVVIALGCEAFLAPNADGFLSLKHLTGNLRQLYASLSLFTNIVVLAPMATQYVDDESGFYGRLRDAYRDFWVSVKATYVDSEWVSSIMEQFALVSGTEPPVKHLCLAGEYYGGQWMGLLPYHQDRRLSYLALLGHST